MLELASQDHKQNFICKTHQETANQNQEVENDQKFMLDYISKKSKSQNISDSDHILMIEKLMKYRLLRDKKWKEYFVSATRFTAPNEIKEHLTKQAQTYFQNFGPATSCFFGSG